MSALPCTQQLTSLRAGASWRPNDRLFCQAPQNWISRQTERARTADRIEGIEAAVRPGAETAGESCVERASVMFMYCRGTEVRVVQNAEKLGLNLEPLYR
jgi:hypothetical protein